MIGFRWPVIQKGGQHDRTSWHATKAVSARRVAARPARRATQSKFLPIRRTTIAPGVEPRSTLNGDHRRHRDSRANRSRARQKQKFAPGYIAKCPAHQDDNPSLSITEKNGTFLIHCFAGCSQEAVVAAVKDLGLWPEGKHQSSDSGFEAIYNYTDERGDLLYQIIRKPGKKFQQRYPDGAGGWIWKKHPHQVLYRLSEVIRPIALVEAKRMLRRSATTDLLELAYAAARGFLGCHNLPNHSAGAVILIPNRDPPPDTNASKGSHAHCSATLPVLFTSNWKTART